MEQGTGTRTPNTSTNSRNISRFRNRTRAIIRLNDKMLINTIVSRQVRGLLIRVAINTISFRTIGANFGHVLYHLNGLASSTQGLFDIRLAQHQQFRRYKLTVNIVARHHHARQAFTKHTRKRFSAFLGQQVQGTASIPRLHRRLTTSNIRQINNRTPSNSLLNTRSTQIRRVALTLTKSQHTFTSSRANNNTLHMVRHGTLIDSIIQNAKSNRQHRSRTIIRHSITRTRIFRRYQRLDAYRWIS